MVTLRSILLMASSLCCAAAQAAESATTTSDGSTATASGSSSTGTPKVHRVNVGAGGYMYDPNVTIADVGDIVTFVFYPTNHSVIRGEYTGSEVCGSGGCNPCVPYDMIHGEGGFNSTNVKIQKLPPANSISATTETFNVTVTSLDPIWYYCNALGSCNPNGMVGVINPANGQDVATQKQAAVKAPYQLGPADAWPAEGQPVGAETATVSGLTQQTSTVPISSSTSTASSSASTSSDHHGLSGGAIAGIAIGGVAVLLLAAALFYFVGRSKAYKDAFHGSGKSDVAGASNAGEKREHVAQWVPPPPGASSASGYTDNRYSYMTQPPMAGPRDSTFVGYNRRTGEPEFAAEAAVQRSNHQSWNSHTSPYVPQGGFTPPIPENQPTFEMAGDTPQRVEIGKSS